MDSTTVTAAAVKIGGQVSDLIELLTTYLQQSVEFGKAQAPDVLNQILVYEAARAHWWMWTGLIIIGVAVLSFVLEYLCDADGFFGGVGILCLLVGTVTAINFHLTIIQIESAPKMYLMEYLARMIS